MNDTLDSEDLFGWYKWKKRFLWIMVAAQATENHDMSEPWSDTYNEGYINQLQLEPTHEIRLFEIEKL